MLSDSLPLETTGFLSFITLYTRSLQPPAAIALVPNIIHSYVPQRSILSVTSPPVPICMQMVKIMCSNA